MKSSIALIGFMGAGKTTIGRELAHRLGLEFVDTDVTIEASTGMTVSSVFATYGEERFRKLEAEAVAETCDRADCVIALGGGALEDPVARAKVRASCVVVFLAASVESILERTAHDDGRPLLHGLSTAERRYLVEDMLYHRTPAYREASDIMVDADRPVAAVVHAILAQLGEP